MPTPRSFPFVRAPSAFCLPHSCGFRCCNGCKTNAVRLYFSHVQKTGGSAVECAVESLVRHGVLISLGHSSILALKHCRDRCGHAPLAVSVRDPYAYHESLYRYVHRGVNSDLAEHLWWRGLWRDSARSPLHSFGRWVQFVTTNATTFTQSARIRKACGSPCAYDFALRTEHLEGDLNLALRRTNVTRRYVRLPRVNVAPTNGTEVPAIAWTRELRSVIEAVEQPLFAEFGYLRIP